MSILLIVAIATVTGTSAGFFIASLFTRAQVRRAHMTAWRECENLHRLRAVQDLRDNTTARLR